MWQDWWHKVPREERPDKAHGRSVKAVYEQKGNQVDDLTTVTIVHLDSPSDKPRILEASVTLEGYPQDHPIWERAQAEEKRWNGTNGQETVVEPPPRKHYWIVAEEGIDFDPIKEAISSLNTPL